MNSVRCPWPHLTPGGRWRWDLNPGAALWHGSKGEALKTQLQIHPLPVSIPAPKALLVPHLTRCFHHNLIHLSGLENLLWEGAEPSAAI